jgi:hypothetical protein
LICFVGEIYDSQSRKQQIGISVGILASISICHMWSFHVCMPDSLASKWKGASFKSAKEWTGQQIPAVCLEIKVSSFFALLESSVRAAISGFSAAGVRSIPARPTGLPPTRAGLICWQQ